MNGKWQRQLANIEKLQNTLASDFNNNQRQNKSGSGFNRYSNSANIGTRSLNNFRGNNRPYNGFSQSRTQLGVSQGFQRAARRGQYTNSRNRGLQRSRDVGQRKGQPRYDRNRSPRPRLSRTPERKFVSSGRNEKTLPRSRSNSRGRSRIACLRCGGNHLASSCTIYKTYSDTSCKICNLLHQTKECKKGESRVHAGELVLDQEIEPEFVEGEQELLDDHDMEAEQEQEVMEGNLVYDDAYEQYPENTWENGEEMDELSPFFLF